jgi:hypothetical protein
MANVVSWCGRFIVRTASRLVHHCTYRHDHARPGVAQPERPYAAALWLRYCVDAGRCGTCDRNVPGAHLARMVEQIVRRVRDQPLFAIDGAWGGWGMATRGA